MAIYRGKTLPFPPSAYQKAIIDTVLKQRKRNLLIDAKAGTGKSTTLDMLCNYITTKPKHQILLCAFNRSIALELKEKLSHYRHVRVSTIHSTGFSALRYKFPGLKHKDAIDGAKYSIIIKDQLKEACKEYDGMAYLHTELDYIEEKKEEILDLFQPAKRIIDLMRLGLNTSWQKGLDAIQIAMNDVAMRRGIIFNDELSKTLAMVIENSIREGLKQMPNKIDFVDMVWAPNVLNLSMWQHPVVMVDEAQDLSPAQLGIVMKSVWDKRYGGRIICVGDPRQAVYAFCGADSKSIEKIQKKLNPIVLPLNECYRCSKTVIAEAQTIVPEIQALPSAKEGSVTSIPFHKMMEMLDEDGEHMVICRKNAPLISLCFALIAEGKNAKIIGREIGQELVNLIRKISDRKGFDFKNFVKHVSDWEKKQVDYIFSKNGGDEEDPVITLINDKASCMRYLYRKLEPFTLEEFFMMLLDLFQEDDDRNAIRLTSAHRSKGLESENVYIIEPSSMPLPVRNEDDFQQEMNLKYVAITRAKENLFWVHGQLGEEA
jgi:superfamily I DNA/RNA helicase